MGGLVLAGEPTCIVLDVGGTSTDISFLDEGFPRLSRFGASVGRWRTKVRATDVWTAALGGDSRVSVVDGRIVFGPDRMLPLGVAADTYPQLMQKVHKTRKFEFVVGVQRNTSKLTNELRQVVKLLLDNGPMEPKEIVDALPGISLPKNFISELKSKGHLVFVGVTPTDLLNVVGAVSRGNRTAAEAGVGIFAHTYGMKKDEFVREALDLIGSRMAEEVLLKFIEDDCGSAQCGKAGEFMLEVMSKARRGSASMTAKINKPIIGIGAPANLFVPRLEFILDTKVIVPENHDVGNAVGAVCSQVFDSVTVEVESYNNVHRVIAPFCEYREFHRLDEALAEAKRMATEYVVTQVTTSGGAKITTKLEVVSNNHRTATSFQNYGYDTVEIMARATGQPSYSNGERACQD
jgi:N-methylhydantoinase A/oxoprolinase/acetone carboxylase beta subunit